MASLYVDENLASLVDPLRAAGHDVVFAGDTGGGRTDPWHFREAIRQRRVFVTLDKSDYTYLHKLWTTLQTLGVVIDSHAGILTAVPARGFTQSVWLPALLGRLATPSDLVGRLFRWLHAKAEWHEDRWRAEGA